LASSILAAAPSVGAERALMIAVKIIELINDVDHYRHEQQQQAN
jgi:hypothetical protein